MLRSITTSGLVAFGIVAAAPLLHADVLLSGDYDVIDANQVDASATSDANANELSFATFEALVEAAFLNQTGGVITFNAGEVINSTTGGLGTSDMVFGDATVLGTIQRTVSGTDIVNDSGDATRTPISGVRAFGGTADFGFVFDPADQINNAGLTVISRSGQTAGNATVTATFADIDGLNEVDVVVTELLPSGNTTDDTFFGFSAPTDKYLTEIRVQTPYFTRIDDLGLTVVPEPGTFVLAFTGGALMLLRRRKG